MNQEKMIIWRFFNGILFFPLIILLILQLPSVIYYVDARSRDPWELVSEAAVKEGIFAEEPEEIVFVYRKKKGYLSPQLFNLGRLPYLVQPPGEKHSEYGKILSIASGILLFGAKSIKH